MATRRQQSFRVVRGEVRRGAERSGWEDERSGGCGHNRCRGGRGLQCTAAAGVESVCSGGHAFAVPAVLAPATAAVVAAASRLPAMHSRQLLLLLPPPLLLLLPPLLPARGFVQRRRLLLSRERVRDGSRGDVQPTLRCGKTKNGPVEYAVPVLQTAGSGRKQLLRRCVHGDCVWAV